MAGEVKTWTACRLPTYEELLARKDGVVGSAWGLFGSNDHIGTINLLNSDNVRSAASLVRRGTTFNLDYELNAFAPPVSPYRKKLQHFAVCRHDGQVHDDFVNDFFPQASTHIDGLRHHRHKINGFYNSVADEQVSADSHALGIQHVSNKGIAGRGVLLDIERYLRAQGRPLNHKAGQAISASDLDGTVRAQGLELRQGDILLLHTGWARHFLNDLDDEARQKQIKERRFTGLEQSFDALSWIWDNHLSVVASDTVAVEVMPSVASSPFVGNVNKMMHPDLIAMLGVCLGELWRLDELAQDCAEDGVYEFMVTSKPLNLVGGVGSPANALALK